MPVAYPSNLPQWAHRGYQEEPVDNLVRTESSVGPPLTRPRSTAPRRRLSVPLKVTETQKNAIQLFHDTALIFGSQEFEKVDFANPGGTTYVYTFAEPPKFQWEGSNVWTTEYKLWLLRAA